MVAPLCLWDIASISKDYLHKINTIGRQNIAYFWQLFFVIFFCKKKTYFTNKTHLSISCKTTPPNAIVLTGFYVKNDTKKPFPIDGKGLCFDEIFIACRKQFCRFERPPLLCRPWKFCLPKVARQGHLPRCVELRVLVGARRSPCRNQRWQAVRSPCR